MTANQVMNATKNQTSTHMHYVGEESGEIVEVETIRSRRALGKRLRSLEDVEAIFRVDGTTIWVR